MILTQTRILMMPKITYYTWMTLIVSVKSSGTKRTALWRAFKSNSEWWVSELKAPKIIPFKKETLYQKRRLRARRLWMDRVSIFSQAITIKIYQFNTLKGLLKNQQVVNKCSTQPVSKLTLSIPRGRKSFKARAKNQQILKVSIHSHLSLLQKKE